MNDDLEELAEEGKVDLLDPVESGISAGGAEFSMAAQRDKFLSGSVQTKEIIPATISEVPPEQQEFIDDLLKANELSKGELLLAIPQGDDEKGDIKLMRQVEFSQDKHPRTSIYGFDDSGILRVDGPLAEEIGARLRSNSPDAHRFGQPINGDTWKDLLENSQGVVDDSGSETNITRINGENEDDRKRLERNLKSNLMMVQMGMEAKTGLVDTFRNMKPTAGTVGAVEALQAVSGNKA